jgi:RNAse (barnase) inhibitor barstar
MKLHALTLPGAPHQHALVASASEAFDALRALESEHLTVRFVRGRRCAMKADFFNELSAALQFPPYFGNNWDACSDCLNDLGWIDEKRGVVLVFLDAPHLLQAATSAESATFTKMIADSALEWTQTRNGKPGRVFHVVFHADGKDEAALAEKWPALPKLAK